MKFKRELLLKDGMPDAMWAEIANGMDVVKFDELNQTQKELIQEQDILWRNRNEIYWIPMTGEFAMAVDPCWCTEEDKDEYKG